METQTGKPNDAWERIFAFANREPRIWGASGGRRWTVIMAATMLVGCALFAIPVNASCGSPRHPGLAIMVPQSESAKALSSVQSSSSNETKNEGDATIVGLWHVKFVSNGALYDEGFDQFHADGTEILNDDGVPPAEGNVCLGVFKKIGPRTFQIKHPAFVWDGNGILIGTLVILETITLDHGHNSYHGQFAFDFYDLYGNLTDVVSGKLNGERITVN